MDSNQLDAVIAHLQDGNHLDEKCVLVLLEKLTEVLYEEPNLLRLYAPVTICGDIHGQLFDLFELFETGGDPATTQYLFMGDYVDRGYFSLETFMYLVALKLKYPQNIHLLRGNHECRRVSESYGFYNECWLNYGHMGVWMAVQDVFDLLPCAAIVDGRVFAVHGGLSPTVPLVELISLEDRFREAPSEGSIADLYWSDPDPEDNSEKWRKNTRGSGYTFPCKAVREFAHLNKLDFVARSHQVVEKGVMWYFPDANLKDASGRLITVWSAPNYAYRQVNKASVLKYGFPGRPKCDLVVFDAAEKRIPLKNVPVEAMYFA